MSRYTLRLIAGVATGFTIFCLGVLAGSMYVSLRIAEQLLDDVKREALKSEVKKKVPYDLRKKTFTSDQISDMYSRIQVSQKD